jgi:hypothetical protein
MEDSDVRDGIRALLKRERCHEEQCRLGLEADNICRWFGDELAALELALRSPASKWLADICSLVLILEDETFLFPLQQRRDHVLQLQTRWVTPLASSIRFASNAKEAVNVALTLSGSKGGLDTSVYMLVPTTLALPEHTEDDTALGITVDDFEAADTIGAEEAALSDIFNGASDDEDSEKDADSMGEPEVVFCWEPPEVLHHVPYRHRALLMKCPRIFILTLLMFLARRTISLSRV